MQSASGRRINGLFANVCEIKNNLGVAKKEYFSNHGIFTDLNIFIPADLPGRLQG